MKLEWKNAIVELENIRKKSLEGAGNARIANQHSKGKLTARERIEILFDEETFVEMFSIVESRIDDFELDKRRVLGDGAIVGYGRINGQLVFASSEDFTILGGTLGEYHAFKICRVMDKAIEMKAPMIFINDSGGARIEEGISSLIGYSDIFFRHTRASGVIPQIALVMGPCAGGACYGPALCDYIFTVKNITKMFITGPEVIKAVTNENVTMEELGEARVHTSITGVAHFCYDTEIECIEGVKKMLSYITVDIKIVEKDVKKKNKLNVFGTIGSKTLVNNTPSLSDLVSDNSRKPYDMHKVIESLCDKDSFFEVQRHFAQNIIIGFARMESRSVAFVCNQPNVKGGSLDCDSSDKMSRFIRFCDCFSIPIITLVDVPGFWPGKQQEHSGIIRHGAKVIYAYSEATVPKITVILRKAYGGAYIAMNSMNMGADVVYAWPIAEIAVMGAEGATKIIWKKKILNSEDPKMAEKQYISEYEKKFMNPYIAAKRGYVTEVIMPNETRDKLLKALSMLQNKNIANKLDKKHGNIPL